MLFLGLSVPGEGPWCSASVLVLLAGFLNSGVVREVIKIYKKQNWAQNTSLWNPLITYKLWLANL